MIVEQENKEKAIQYLFGELGESERDALEERIFSDEDFSLFLEATENDLVDEYARGEMDFALRERFIKNYLISENRHEKVRLATILQKEVFAERKAITPIMVESKPSVWESLSGFFRIPNLAWAGGLAAILLGILVIGLMFLRQGDKTDDYAKDDNSNRQTPIPTPQFSPEVSPTAQSNTQTNETPNQIINANKSANQKPDKKPTPMTTQTVTPTPAPLEKRETPAPPPEPQIFVATLLPLLRSDDKPTLNIPKNSQTVQLKIVHDNQKPFAKYRLDVRNQDGDVIYSRTTPVNPKNLSRPINLNLRNSLLKTGSYEITLSGILPDNSAEEIKFYNFAVNQKR